MDNQYQREAHLHDVIRNLRAANDTLLAKLQERDKQLAKMKDALWRLKRLLKRKGETQHE